MGRPSRAAQTGITPGFDYAALQLAIGDIRRASEVGRWANLHNA